MSEDWRKTMCPYCGVGCGLLVRLEEGRVTKVKGDPDHPANFGDVCAKAVHLPPALHTPDRSHARLQSEGPVAGAGGRPSRHAPAMP